MMLEDELKATLRDYEKVAPDAHEVLRWLDEHTVAERPTKRMRIWPVAVAALLVVAVALALAFLGRADSRPTNVGALPTNRPAPTSPATSTPTIPPFRYTKTTTPGALIPRALRQRAEAISVPLLATPQTSFRLASVRDQVVVLTWSASWCGPCRTAYASSLNAGAFPRSVQRVTIATKERRAGAAALFVAKTARGPVGYDQTGNSLTSFGGLPQALPLTVLIDREQRVAAVYINPDLAVLARTVTSLSKE